MNKMGLFRTKENLTHLEWRIHRDSPGTPGSYLKSYEVKGTNKYYYKMPLYNSVDGVLGHEGFNEIIAMNIAEQLGFDCLHYDLVHCDIKVDDTIIETFITSSLDFKKPNDKAMSIETWYDIEKLPGEKPFDFITRKGYSEFCYKMFILDYLIFNRDRHGANIEVLYNNGVYRMAPLFDHGLSFMCFGREPSYFVDFDKLQYAPANNFIGPNDVISNLKLVPKEIIQNIQKPTDIFKGLEDFRGYMPTEFWEQIQIMFDKRWYYVKNL